MIISIHNKHGSNKFLQFITYIYHGLSKVYRPCRAQQCHSATDWGHIRGGAELGHAPPPPARAAHGKNTENNKNGICSWQTKISNNIIQLKYKVSCWYLSVVPVYSLTDPWNPLYRCVNWQATHRATDSANCCSSLINFAKRFST